jgi:nucleotide-binding universal stress UspA family protein
LARIAHTTDFSDQSDLAFAHALRLAVAAPERLDILHVKRPTDKHAWQHFPPVRETLIRWGMLPGGAARAEIEKRLGIHVEKIEFTDADPVAAIGTFLLTHRPDLLVVATHGRAGFNRWLRGSFAEGMVERAHVPTLLIGPESRGFVDGQTGRMELTRVLVPVDERPNPAQSLRILSALLSSFGIPSGGIELLHVGEDFPDLMDASGQSRTVERQEGPVVATILKAAEHRGVHLVAMPTTGRHGFLDAVRGSTTSQVVARAPCPVLTLPLVGA